MISTVSGATVEGSPTGEEPEVEFFLPVEVVIVLGAPCFPREAVSHRGLSNFLVFLRQKLKDVLALGGPHEVFPERGAHEHAGDFRQGLQMQTGGVDRG